MLKPCPFCGNEQISVYEYDPYDGYQGDCSRTRVSCRECKATIEDRSRDKAINKWNRGLLVEVKYEAVEEALQTLKARLNYDIQKYENDFIDYNYRTGAIAFKIEACMVIDELLNEYRTERSSCLKGEKNV